MCGTEMSRFTSSSPYITSDNEVLVNFVALTDEGTEQERNGFQVEYEIGKRIQDWLTIIHTLCTEKKQRWCLFCMNTCKGLLAFNQTKLRQISC